MDKVDKYGVGYFIPGYKSDPFEITADMSPHEKQMRAELNAMKGTRHGNMAAFANWLATDFVEFWEEDFVEFWECDVFGSCPEPELVKPSFKQWWTNYPTVDGQAIGGVDYPSEKLSSDVAFGIHIWPDMNLDTL